MLDNAFVSGDAVVRDGACMYDNARAMGNAVLCETASMFGHTIIDWNARVSGWAKMYHNAIVTCNGVVRGNAQLSDHSRVCDNGTVEGSAILNNHSCVGGIAIVGGNVVMRGDMRYGHNITVSKTPLIAVRSDGYYFSAVPCADGKTRVVAGCRFFTYREAYKHWFGMQWDNPLRRESLDILHFIDQRPWYVRWFD